MGIVSKRIEYRRPQANGLIRVREEHTDQFGNKHYFGPYFVTSDVEADNNLANRDLIENLVNSQIADVKQWVVDRNTVASFNFTGLDITQDQAEEEILKHFARSEGDEALKYAWWLESLNPPSWAAITTRLGWSNTTGQIGERVQTRAQNMVVAENDINRIEDV